MIGALLFTAQQALLHPMHVVKTRMQVAEHSGVSPMRGVAVFRNIVRNDGIHGLYRGFGTSAIGSLHGRVLALTSLGMSKDMCRRWGLARPSVGDHDTVCAQGLLGNTK